MTKGENEFLLGWAGICMGGHKCSFGSYHLCSWFSLDLCSFWDLVFVSLRHGCVFVSLRHGCVFVSLRLVCASPLNPMQVIYYPSCLTFCKLNLSITCLFGKERGRSSPFYANPVLNIVLSSNTKKGEIERTFLSLYVFDVCWQHNKRTNCVLQGFQVHMMDDGWIFSL